MQATSFKRFLSATMIILAACSVGETTGPAPTLNTALQKQLLPNGEVMQTARDMSAADTSFVFLSLQENQSKWYFVGPHKLYVQARSVCDPVNSGYGLSYWLLPCTRLRANLAVTAKYWTDSRGYARIEFGPDVRFAPDKPATLYMKDLLAATQPSSAILYCVDGTDTCVNESALDPSLASSRDPQTGWVWRIIRHFSGYNVWA